MGKKKKKKGQKKRTFTQQIAKVLHQKGGEIALALITGIITNYLTDASEKLLQHFTKTHSREHKKKLV